MRGLSLRPRTTRALEFQRVVVAVRSKMRPENGDALIALVAKMPGHKQQRRANGHS